MTDGYEKELAFAKELAAKAIPIAQKYYKTDLAFKTKSDASPVTIADETVNQMVIDQVKKHFPDYGVLGEEQSWQLDKKLLWVCDPIDGTIAFSMGEPTFMFSIALIDDGAPLVAVTADLANGDIFWATKGGGAYRNDKSIHVNARTMAEAWLVFPTNFSALYKYQALNTSLKEAAYQTNIIHGGVFKGMLAAQGLIDGIVYPETVSPWDIVAVKLIVEEAGGKVTDKNGGEPRFDEPAENGIIVSNGVTHQELLDIVAANPAS